MTAAGLKSDFKFTWQQQDWNQISNSHDSSRTEIRFQIHMTAAGLKSDFKFTWQQQDWNQISNSHDSSRTEIRFQIHMTAAGLKSDFKFTRHPITRPHGRVMGCLLWGFWSKLINSLWPGDTIWRQRSGSTLAQVMACCLSAPSHYLNQYWLIIIQVEWHSSECNFTRETSATNHWN